MGPSIVRAADLCHSQIRHFAQLLGEVLAIALGLWRELQSGRVRPLVLGMAAQGFRQHQRFFVLQTLFGLQGLVDLELE